MTKQELYELTTKLYECSELMKDLNMDCSDVLLQMSSETLALLSRTNLPEDIQAEIADIKSEILSDG